MEPIDPDSLAAFSGGDVSIEREILENFLRVNEVDAAQLQAAVLARELPKIEYWSHRLKGAARMLGAQRVADAAEAIELASRAGDCPAVVAAADRFTTAAEVLRAWIRLRLGHSAGL
jgi:two-component system sensor histidine kinase EvgS